MPRKKLMPIGVDHAILEQMTSYASEHGLELSALVGRMWALWQAIEAIQHEQIIPAYPRARDDLDSFLAGIEAQADMLDEDYQRDEQQQQPAASERDKAIANYYAAHPFIPDSDDDLVICPSCSREIKRAGLVYLPNDVIKCDYCYTLPKLLNDFEVESH